MVIIIIIIIVTLTPKPLVHITNVMEHSNPFIQNKCLIESGSLPLMRKNFWHCRVHTTLGGALPANGLTEQNDK
jgi:hypothetical protein